MELFFTPTLESAETKRRLDRLLVPGSLLDPPLSSRIDRIARDFRSYAGSYPLPLWAPGLVIDNEMRGLTEALLPMSRLRGVFELLLRRGCRFAPILSGSYLQSAPCWLDLLQKLEGEPGADPAALLRELAEEPQQRRNFLFALQLPRHFGGSFDRYPLQSRWIRSWLGENRARLGGRIRLLDSACGSGEGCYGLAELAGAAGFGGEGCAVHGSTLEPIELFAGAHAFFPHDPGREREYRRRVAPLLSPDAPLGLEFYLEDVGSRSVREPYDLVLCNGLLGGPLMHELTALSRAVGALASRLAPGGVLLAADRFHAGWRQRVPEASLTALMREQGLEPVQVCEGIGGVRAL